MGTSSPCPLLRFGEERQMYYAEPHFYKDYAPRGAEGWAATRGISLLISLAGAFILISLDKLNKLTGILNPLNTKDRIF
jgi:hypothetical protein